MTPQADDRIDKFENTVGGCMLPMTINFTISNVSASSELDGTKSVPTLVHRLSFIAHASDDTDIVLSDGTPMSSHQVHMQLISGLSSVEQLDRNLTSTDVGFLINVKQSTEKDPFIHGAIFWPGPLPYHLLQPGLGKHLRLTIEDMPDNGPWGEPVTWEAGRDHSLRISELSLGCFPSE
jgi:hypothetical protein